MAKIFLSYRRTDTSGYAKGLADGLSQRFGPGSIVRDLDSIPPGTDYPKFIAASIEACDAMVVLIGREWLDARDAGGNRRLEDPKDLVRQEIAHALRRDIPVVPVLVEGVDVPAANRLPVDLRALAERNALEVSDTRWDYDVGRLAQGLRLQIADKASQPSAYPPGHPPAHPREGSGSRGSRRPVFGFLAISAVVVVGLVAGAAWFTSSRSAGIAVPNVIGQDSFFAGAAMDYAGLVPNPLDEPSATMPAGRVTRTVPSAGTKVARATVIAIYVSTGPPKAATPQRSPIPQPSPTTTPTRTSPSSPQNPTSPPANHFTETTMDISPMSGPVGTLVRVNGAGFQAGETVQVLFQTSVVASTKADSSGAFANLTFTVPASASGFTGFGFGVAAVGLASSRSAHSTFTLTS